MKNIEDLNAQILKITMEIRDKHHELSKFINEMPITIPDESNPEINIQILQEYYNSLCNLLKKYEANHIDKN